MKPIELKPSKERKAFAGNKRLYNLKEASTYLGRSIWGVRELICQVSGSGLNNEALMNDLFIVKGKGASRLEDPRVYFPSAFCHVIARGNQRQAIFLDKQDYQRSLYDVSEYKTCYPFFVPMPSCGTTV